MNQQEGVLLIDKEKNMTSHDVVAIARGVLGIKRIGHCGTLDPLATGLLVLLLGKATKLQHFFMEDNKEYQGEILLGQITSTQDMEGEVIASSSVPPFSLEQIQTVFDSYLGHFKQIPPMFSAIKKSGVPLYKLARKGKFVNRDPREVFVQYSEILGFDGKVIQFSLSCSKGFYVRVYAQDIGKDLGCGACLQNLKRIRSGNFSVSQAISVEDLRKARWQKAFLPLEKVQASILS